MALLTLTIATWDYDRVRPLIDGRVTVEGCEVRYLPMPVEEIFQRAYFHNEFDVTELGFSPYLIALSRGMTRYRAIPAFLSRSFRHNAIYIRTDRGIERPEDLRGKTVGVPEYQMSAALWARGLLADRHGVAAADMAWVQGGLEVPGRREKFPLNLPEGFPLRVENEKALSAMLAAGEIDAMMSARAPSCFIEGHQRVARLFADPKAAEQDYFRSTGVFPIMHAVGVRDDLVAKYPWLAMSLLKAFEKARRIAMDDLAEVAAIKLTLPWLTAHLEETRSVMGEDFWTYGFENNRKTLEAMTRYSFAQGLSARHLAPEELFVPSTLDAIRV